MTRISLLFCFATLVAFGSVLNGVSAHTKLSEPVPHHVKDIETFVSNEVMKFVTELEKNCPVTKAFSVFFQKLKDYVKLMCPVSSMMDEKSLKIKESEMNLKAGKVFHEMVALHAGKRESGPLKMALRKKITEAIGKLNKLRAIIHKIQNAHQSQQNASMTLTIEQEKEIELGILEFEREIKQVVKIAIQSDGEPSVDVLIDV